MDMIGRFVVFFIYNCKCFFNKSQLCFIFPSIDNLIRSASSDAENGLK